MKIKPFVLQWAAAACFGVGLIYALGIEGGAQVGQSITDGEFVTAMVLILAAIALGRLSFALPCRSTAAAGAHEAVHLLQPQNRGNPRLRYCKASIPGPRDEDGQFLYCRLPEPNMGELQV